LAVDSSSNKKRDLDSFGPGDDQVDDADAVGMAQNEGVLIELLFLFGEDMAPAPQPGVKDVHLNSIFELLKIIVALICVCCSKFKRQFIMMF